MIEIIGLICTGLAIIGVILNNRRMIQCFYIWIFSNLLAAIIHYQTGIYSLLLRDCIF